MRDLSGAAGLSRARQSTSKMVPTHSYWLEALVSYWLLIGSLGSSSHGPLHKAAREST